MELQHPQCGSPGPTPRLAQLLSRRPCQTSHRTPGWGCHAWLPIPCTYTVQPDAQASTSLLFGHQCALTLQSPPLHNE